VFDTKSFVETKSEGDGSSDSEENENLVVVGDPHEFPERSSLLLRESVVGVDTETVGEGAVAGGARVVGERDLIPAEMLGLLRDGGSLLEGDLAVERGLISGETSLEVGPQTTLDTTNATESDVCGERLWVEQLVKLTRREGEWRVLDDEVGLAAGVWLESILAPALAEHARGAAGGIVGSLRDLEGGELGAAGEGRKRSIATLEVWLVGGEGVIVVGSGGSWSDFVAVDVGLERC
jgi:hypothetical protein